MKYLRYGLLFCTVLWFGCRPSIDEKELAYTKIIERNKPKDGFPKPVGYVNDFDSIFSVTEKNKLQDKLQRYDNLTYNRIILVTIPSYYQYSSIDDFAKNLGEQWDMTKKEIDNTIFIIVNLAQKEVKIELGSTSENFIQDSIKEKITENLLQDALPQNKLYDGFDKAINKLIMARQKSTF